MIQKLGSLVSKPLVTYDRWRREVARRRLGRLSSEEAKVDLDLDLLQIPRRFESQLYLNPRDAGISADLYTWGFREPVYTYMLHKFLLEERRDVDCVVDVGSNIGYFPLVELMSDVRQILAIEPVRDTFHFLKRNLDCFKNVTTLNMAVSDSKEDIRIYVPNKANFATALENIDKFDSETFVRRVEKVTAAPLEEIVDSGGLRGASIVLRMDVEGFEERILRKIPREVHGISFETHPQFIGVQATLNLLGRLMKSGYRLWAAVHYGMLGVVILTRYFGLLRALHLFGSLTHKPQIFLGQSLEDFDFVKDLMTQGQWTHIFMVRAA